MHDGEGTPTVAGIVASTRARPIRAIAAGVAAAAAVVTLYFLVGPTKTSMPPLEVTLQPASFADLPGWRRDDHLAAFKTFLRSCDEVIKAGQGGKGEQSPTGA